MDNSAATEYIQNNGMDIKRLHNHSLVRVLWSEHTPERLDTVIRLDIGEELELPKYEECVVIDRKEFLSLFGMIYTYKLRLSDNNNL